MNIHISLGIDEACDEAPKLWSIQSKSIHQFGAIRITPSNDPSKNDWKIALSTI